MRTTRKLIVSLTVAATALVGTATAAGALGADPCPSGYKGVIVDADSAGEYQVCTNLV